MHTASIIINRKLNNNLMVKLKIIVYCHIEVPKSCSYKIIEADTKVAQAASYVTMLCNGMK